MSAYQKPTGNQGGQNASAGGNASPSGSGSSVGAGRPQGSPNSKSVIRYEQIARYRVAGRMSDAKIAEMVGLTPGALALAIKTPTYKEIEEGLLEGRLTQIDEQIAGDDEQIRDIARAAVPAALRALVEGVTQRRDLRSALVAAKTILQFDPNKTLTEQGKAPVERGSGDSGPQLPENVIAYLSMQGNKVVAEIRTSSRPQTGQPSAEPNVQGEEKVSATPLASQAPSEPQAKIPLVLQAEGEA